MKSCLFIVIIGLLISCSTPLAQESLDLLPTPQKVNLGSSTISFDTQSSVSVEGLSQDSFLFNYLNEKLPIDVNSLSSRSLRFEIIRDENIDNEGYQLQLSQEGFLARATSPSGLFYAAESIITLMHQYQEGTSISIPTFELTDAPAFKWRGMHLDVSRHFFDTAFIKEYIDILAMHKMNVFHWHLVDDQGWRIEIKKYPKLTEIGAWRKPDKPGIWDFFIELASDGEPRYGGFYTQQEIKEIIAYAEERNITIVPEIEMPGHSWAALSAYPQFSCSGEIWKKPDNVSFEFSDPYCVGNDSTIIFLKDILSEVMELFPSQYIHIGGDEAKKTPWETCNKCQRLLQQQNMKDVDELHGYLISEMEKHLAKHGRKLIGWDEILASELPNEAIVMSWQGETGGIKAAKAGHDVVMAPDKYVYFNMFQSNEIALNKDFRFALPIKQVYEYNIKSEAMTPAQQQHILGAQACLWTEFVSDRETAITQILPRLAALSEITWSAKNKNYPDFSRKLTKLFNRYDAERYPYFIEPVICDALGKFIDKTSIALNSDYPYAEIRYSLDGSDPLQGNLTFSDSIGIAQSCDLRAIAVLPNGATSNVLIKKIEKVRPIEAMAGGELYNGINYTYDEVQIAALDEYVPTKMTQSGQLDSLVFPINAREDFFVLNYSGYLSIPNTAIHELRLTSDDGSRLVIDEQLVIDNDSIHAPISVQGAIALEKGYHPFNLLYFEGNYGQMLKLEYKDDTEWKDVPKNWFYVRKE